MDDDSKNTQLFEETCHSYNHLAGSLKDYFTFLSIQLLLDDEKLGETSEFYEHETIASLF